MADASATTWLDRLTAGEISSRELVERTLGRIETANAEVNAVTAIHPERSLAAAEEADRERAASGGANDDRPLLGLPVTIKDTVDVEGWTTTAGVVAERDRVATADSTVVARLRAAGAIVVAKSNVPECS
ncbi:MAG: amidase, partial [Actinobacteria bacterium]|nr:amidase [Actinomycetota bacterium]